MTRTLPAAVATVSTLLLPITACTSAPIQGPTIERIVAISDGDHLASTYADGMLADGDAGHRDLLTTMSVADGEVRTAQVEVSNSVTAAPEVLALSPDGATAFVAERLGPRGPGVETAPDLVAGNRLFAVDVSDLDAPAVERTVSVAESPEAVAVHPDGTAIAVVANTPSASVLQIIPWSATGFGAPSTHDLATLGVTGTRQGPRGGVLATNVQWHPEGAALAVNITSQNRVAMLRVDGAAIRPWHDPVTVGTDPFVGRFTPDGRHYLTADWGRDLDAPDLEGRLPDGPSRISVIEIGDIASPHRVIASVATDKSSEGLAVSPDGRWVATVNMRGTALPAESPEYDELGSVTLLRRDVESGELSKIADTPLTAVLPEGGTFDPSGRYFIATSFQGRPGEDGGSGLQVFALGPDDAPGLTPVARVPLPHGVHHVAVG